MNSGLTSHQQRGHTETGPRFKVSSERPEKQGIDLATPGLVVQCVIHYTTAAPIVFETTKPFVMKFHSILCHEQLASIIADFELLFMLCCI